MPGEMAAGSGFSQSPTALDVESMRAWTSTEATLASRGEVVGESLRMRRMGLGRSVDLRVDEAESPLAFFRE